jgi:flavodoxin I
MKVLVVYDSVYGNTEIIAQAIAQVIPVAARVLRVGQVKAADWQGVDLLVLGSPTHGSMPTEAVRRFLAQVGSPGQEGARAATFDTRLTWPFLERWGGFAAPKMADTLAEKGWTLVGEPGGFFVRGLKKGPLKRGEADRAAAWARALFASQG